MNNFIESITPIVAIICTVALPVVLGMYIAILSMRNKHSQNMELIKQGIVPPEESKAPPSKYKTLRNGILVIGIAIGLGVGLIIGKTLNLGEDNMFWSVAPCILFSLGLAYLIFYMMVKNKDFE